MKIEIKIIDKSQFQLRHIINIKDTDMVYLGTPQAKIEFNKVVFMLQHPGGGCARSLSYKPQIAIDEMETNEKPNIFLQGHFHKAYGTVYRNVHTFFIEFGMFIQNIHNIYYRT